MRRIYIKYWNNGEVFYEDQTGTSRSLTDIQVRAQELDGEVTTEDEEK